MTEENGFTLVELLAALVAGSLLLAAISWVVGSLGRELHARPRDAAVAALTTITPALTTMLERAGLPDKAGNGFTAERSRLTATVPPPDALEAVGPLTLTITAERTRRGEGLMMTLAAVDPMVHLPASVVGPRLLADGFTGIDFEYVHGDDAATPQLPRLILIRFTDAARAVRTIAVEPRINADGRCQFDLISLACR